MGGEDGMCRGAPGGFVDVRGPTGLRRGMANLGGPRREICLSYTPEAAIGSYVLVHVGFAISVISEDEARETRDLLEEIGALGEGSAA